MLYISQAAFDRLVKRGVEDHLTNQVGSADVTIEQLRSVEHEVTAELLGRYTIADQPCDTLSS